MQMAHFGPPGGIIIKAMSPQFAPNVRGPLDGEDARSELERQWPLLEAAILAYAPTHRLEHVRDKLDSGHAQLWTTPHAAFVSEIRIWPTGLREAVGWLAGGDIDELLMMQPAFEEWAREKTCRRVGILLGRSGWSRKLPGYRSAGIQMMKDLTL